MSHDILLYLTVFPILDDLEVKVHWGSLIIQCHASHISGFNRAVSQEGVNQAVCRRQRRARAGKAQHSQHPRALGAETATVLILEGKEGEEPRAECWFIRGSYNQLPAAEHSWESRAANARGRFQAHVVSCSREAERVHGKPKQVAVLSVTYAGVSVAQAESFPSVTKNSSVLNWLAFWDNAEILQTLQDDLKFLI